MYATEMIATYPADINLDRGLIADGIEACYACEQPARPVRTRA